MSVFDRCIEADGAWRALIARCGPARDADRVDAGELARAVADGRVLEIETSRDGFGGGSVWISRVAPTTPPGAVRPDRWHLGYRAHVVFQRRLELSDAELDTINRNCWEGSGEIPLIEG